MSIEICPLAPEEIPFMKEMMYEALFVRPGQSPFPRDILERPELAKYLVDGGSQSYAKPS
ncbi:MAG: hypothetical protein AAFZ63_08515 [Bacteroidota bacterium]